MDIKKKKEELLKEFQKNNEQIQKLNQEASRLAARQEQLKGQHALVEEQLKDIKK
jgi:predicted  nucleic acid-binding Zn-ribbon protein